ncbi:Mitogen-activated protein kinase kinase kinase YODA [Acorus gramineus]|uniref:Mitogen-activated protein kinase kinase kinase YODA n=1 Tax=Acorus gramineus TaxID=55184 RepID=A0AAV9BHY2_ACOGR|nr:Mitogen-activated protein kinase kinase kinase YODA [Acorus gramineus]
MDSHVYGTCEWTRGRTLGRGASSAVVSLAIRRSTGHLFAVKSAELSRSADLRREHRILSSVAASPRVVSCFGEEITVEGGVHLYNLLMEYVPGGTISDEIRRRGGRLDELDSRRYTSDILRGLSHLHAAGIAHCDIKGANVLLAGGAAKIADLGCARSAGDDLRPISGTPAYMAPEVARGGEQGPPADVWALGCAVVEMVTGRAPLPEATDAMAAMFRIGFSEELPEIPEKMSEEGKDFLRRCFVRDPKQRPTAEELMKHAFVDLCRNSAAEGVDESPKCVLDQGFWDAVEDEEMPTTSGGEGGDCWGSPAERIGRLCFGAPPEPANGGDDDDWINVRSADDNNGGVGGGGETVERDEGDQLIIGEGTLRIRVDDDYDYDYEEELLYGEVGVF